MNRDLSQINKFQRVLYENTNGVQIIIIKKKRFDPYIS